MGDMMNVKRQTNWWVLIIFTWILTTAAALFIPSKIFCSDLPPIPDSELALVINNRIGTGYTTWYAIMNYLYFDAANAGSTKEEVHAVLSEIGPWEIIYSGSPRKHFRDEFHDSGVYQEFIQFTEASTKSALHEWVFLYDENNILLEKRVRAIFNNE